MIGAVIAMQCEADILLKDMQITRTEIRCGKKVYVGTAHGKEIALVVCGVGKVNAASGAQMLLDVYSATVLLNFGVAGGIYETTEIAGCYQIEKAVQYDFDLAGLNNTKIGTLDEFTENYLPVCTLPEHILPLRKLATGDRFNDNPQDHLLIKDYMQADIREMEGGAIAQVAIHAKTPCYLWKTISDKAGNVSSFEQYNQNKLRALDNLHEHFPALFATIQEA